MRLGIYGGSFDPPHLAHVRLAEALLDLSLVDRILVVPVGEHAFAKNLSRFSHRWEMCLLAFAQLSGVTVTDLELHLPRPSYTIHTIRAVRDLYPEAELRLIVGADVLPELPRWHRIDELLELAPALPVGRVGFHQPGVVELQLPDIASSRLRQQLREQRSADSPSYRQLPPAVASYILQHGLYL